MTATLSDAIEAGVRHLRDIQTSDGYWAGEQRNFQHIFAYGVSLVQLGFPIDGPEIQSICDDVESFFRPQEGGFTANPDGPPEPMVNYNAVMFLERCRPTSPTIAPARAFQRRMGRIPIIPLDLIHQWILQPHRRHEIVNHKAPSMLMRRITWRLAKSQFATGAPGDASIGMSKPPGLFERKVVWPMLSWLLWPTPRNLGRLTPETDPADPYAGQAIYVAFYVLQLLAGDASRLGRDRDVTARYLEPFMRRFIYEDRSVLYVSFVPLYLLYFEATGREDDLAALRKTLLEAHTYRAGGWMGGSMLSLIGFDSGLAVETLLACGVPPDDPTMVRALDYFEKAQGPDGGWCWSWVPACGAQHRPPDSDDTALIPMMLLQTGREIHELDRVLDLLTRFQSSAGVFNVFLWGIPSYSNTSRALQLLRRMGRPLSDPVLARGHAWLMDAMTDEGTWQDYWFAGPFYGTLMVLEAVIRTGYMTLEDPVVRRATRAVASMQNPDGGWGTDFWGRRTGVSAAEHTAWAVSTLCLYTTPDERPYEAIREGMAWLIRNQREDGSWAASECAKFTASNSYADTMYAQVWPLQALAACRRVLDEEGA